VRTVVVVRRRAVSDAARGGRTAQRKDLVIELHSCAAGGGRAAGIVVGDRE
jgi:hypothetical protein